MALMGAGLACYATHEAQELGWFGCSSSWFNKVMSDMSDCCNDSENEFFKFLRTTLGYQDKPTPAELIVWLIRMGMTGLAAIHFLAWETAQLVLQSSNRKEEVGDSDDEKIQTNLSDKESDLESGFNPEYQLRHNDS